MSGIFKKKSLVLAIMIILSVYLVSLLINESFASNSSSSIGITEAGIHVDNFPVGIAVNDVTNKIYVTNEYSNTVSVINGNNDTEDETIPVGVSPYDVDVDHLTNKVYVANLRSNFVSIIDGETNKVIANISNVTTPVGLDVDSTSSYLYVTSINKGLVYKVNLVTNKVNDTTKVGDSPYTVDIDPAGKKIYVSNLVSDNVSVINATSFSLIKNIAVGKHPVGLAASNSNTVYVANRESGNVSVIDTTSYKVVKNLTVGNKPDGIDVNFRTGMIYVTNTGSNTVSVINDKTKEVVGKEIPVNNNVSPELAQKKEHEIPPTNRFPNVASFVDTNRNTNMIYVTNTGSSVISVINGTTNTLQVGLTFKITPPNSGIIVCRDPQDKNVMKYNTNRYIRIDYRKMIECYAKPNPGSTYSYWIDSRLRNTTFSSAPSEPLNWTLSWFQGFFSSKNSSPRNIMASEYGMTSIAHFRAGPDSFTAIILPLIFIGISAIITVGIAGVRWLYRKLSRKFIKAYYMSKYYKSRLTF